MKRKESLIFILCLFSGWLAGLPTYGQPISRVYSVEQAGQASKITSSGLLVLVIEPIRELEKGLFESRIIKGDSILIWKIKKGTANELFLNNVKLVSVKDSHVKIADDHYTVVRDSKRKWHYQSEKVVLACSVKKTGKKKTIELVFTYPLDKNWNMLEVLALYFGY